MRIQNRAQLVPHHGEKYSLKLRMNEAPKFQIIRAVEITEVEPQNMPCSIPRSRHAFDVAGTYATFAFRYGYGLSLNG